MLQASASTTCWPVLVQKASEQKASLRLGSQEYFEHVLETLKAYNWYRGFGRKLEDVKLLARSLD